MTDDRRDSHGRWTPGHSGNESTQFKPGDPRSWQPRQSGNPGGSLPIHGGEAAIKALQHNQPLTGIAAELEREVHDEIERDGLVSVMRRTAEAHLAVSRLFLGLLRGCETIADADKFAKRYGWLNSKAFRMLAQLRELEQARGEGGIVLDAMAAAREAKGEG